MPNGKQVFDELDGFEWDEVKRRRNISKHDLDFADAVEVFDDARHYTTASPVASSERRFVSVGTVRGLLIAVVSTIRNKKLRIISARIARKNERKKYGQEDNG